MLVTKQHSDQSFTQGCACELSVCECVCQCVCVCVCVYECDHILQRPSGWCNKILILHIVVFLSLWLHACMDGVVLIMGGWVHVHVLGLWWCVCVCVF